MNEHMRTTDRGNEISSIYPRSRQRYDDAHDRDKRDRAWSYSRRPGRGCTTIFQVYMAYLITLEQFIMRRRTKNLRCKKKSCLYRIIIHGLFDHKDPQTNALDCCRVNRQRYYEYIYTPAVRSKILSKLIVASCV